jgi:hypothetical protein
VLAGRAARAPVRAADRAAQKRTLLSEISFGVQVGEVGSHGTLRNFLGEIAESRGTERCDMGRSPPRSTSNDVARMPMAVWASLGACR